MATTEKGFGEDSLIGALAVLFVFVNKDLDSGIALGWNCHKPLFAKLEILPAI